MKVTAENKLIVNSLSYEIEYSVTNILLYVPSLLNVY